MAKPGRPSKGPRREVRGKIPDPLADVVDEVAAASGYADRTEWLTAVLADAVGRPEYKPALQHQQEALKIPA